MKNKKFKYLATFSLGNLLMQILVLLFIPLVSITASAAESNEDDIEQTEGLISEPNEEIELAEIPTVFKFTQPILKTRVNDVVTLSFESNQEVNEVLVRLPREATVINKSPNDSISMEENQNENLWLLRYQHLQKSFSIDVVFEEYGSYEAFVGDSRVAIDVEDVRENSLSVEQEIDYEESIETDNTEFLNEENEINLLENSNFIFERGVSTTIPSWEMASSTTPVNALLRNLTISQVNSGDWNQLSDGNFRIGGSGNLNVLRTAGTRTFLISQTIPTVRNQRYSISIRARNVGEDARLTMTAYSGTGQLAGSNPLGSLGYDLSETIDTYNLSFTATSNLTTIGFRAAGSHVVFSDAIVVPEKYSLTLEASPSIGGTPSTDKTNLLLGESATLAANPNPGYQFSHWEVVSGVGSDITSASNPDTTFIMGSSDTIVRAIYEVDMEGTVHVQHLDTDGNEISESEVLTGSIGEEYQTEARAIEHYQLRDIPYNATGNFAESLIFVTYIYELEEVNPMDPINPGESIDPENTPDFPQDQGLFSIDFVSRFNFGTQSISASRSIYYAQPQRLLDENGTVINDEFRPNFIQISDRRNEEDRRGWQLSVTQRGQFSSRTGHQLLGSRVQMSNMQALSVQGEEYSPTPVSEHIELIPDMKQVLLTIPENEKANTWIYRFGDMETARNSIALELPQGTNPENTQYNTTFDWELSSVPTNQ